MGHSIKQAVCDMGYRKHNYDGDIDMQLARHHRKRVKMSMLRWSKRRSAIEPVIGHLKNEYDMEQKPIAGRRRGQA